MANSCVAKYNQHIYGNVKVCMCGSVYKSVYSKLAGLDGGGCVCVCVCLFLYVHVCVCLCVWVKVRDSNVNTSMLIQFY